MWIKFLDRKGKLTVGYGSPQCIGPELEFGTVVGKRYEEQVLPGHDRIGRQHVGPGVAPDRDRPLPVELEVPPVETYPEARRHAGDHSAG